MSSRWVPVSHQRVVPTMRCSHCGIEIATNALICYRCGASTTDPRIKPPPQESVFGAPTRSRWPLVAVVAAGVVVVAVVIWLVLGP